MRQSSFECVKNAIFFRDPDRVPVWYFNRDLAQSDIVYYDTSISDYTAKGDRVSEWGYMWENLGDGTMGQPKDPVIADWARLDGFAAPDINEERRFGGARQFVEQYSGKYLLSMLTINCYTTYTFVRGFDNSMIDFALERENAERLLDIIFAFEMRLVEFSAKYGFHGYHIGDDWGAQSGLLISPAMWHELFYPRYKSLFDHAHALGLDIWFHSCGDFTEIIEALHGMGADVINISQPNTVDLEKAAQLRGKQCFLLPISYQTTSISGTAEDIQREAQRLYTLFGTPRGGFIGYVEEYESIGLSEENYQACKQAFANLSLV